MAKTEQNNRQIIEAEVSKIVSKRPHRIPATMTSTLILGALLEELERTNSLLEQILKQSGGQASTAQPRNWLTQFFTRKKK